MKKLVRQTYNLLELLRRLRAPGLAWKLHREGGSWKDFCRSDAGIIVRDTGLVVDAANAVLLARASSEIRRLGSGAGAQWRFGSGLKLEARIQDLCFEVAVAEDVFVLNEIFALGVYAIQYPAPATVIDIGANIGASALYFAAKPWVKQVFAFEPLKPTAQITRSNFQRNPQYQNKITLFEYGLGARDETIEVDYSPEWKGNVGRRPLPTNLTKNIPVWKESIAIRNASQSLSGILESAAGPVILKMDCEGAEWDILPDLAASGQLKRIDQMMFEWHHKTPEALERLLVENGFSTIRRIDVVGAEVGLIYASRAGART